MKGSGAPTGPARDDPQLSAPAWLADRRKDRPSHFPAIDGLRAVAILLVLWHHALWLFHRGDESLFASPFWRTSAAGWMGVDLFFVISGFLITGILLQARRRRGSRLAALRAFWIRRALRIFPLGYLYLAVIFSLAALGAADLNPPGAGGIFLYLSYLGNWHIAATNWPDECFALLWSLAIEEQFYLVWPLLALFLRWTVLCRICFLILIGAPILRCVIAVKYGYPAVYLVTFCRADTLAAGALLALLFRSEALRERVVRGCRRLVAPGMLAVAWFASLPFGPSKPAVQPLLLTVVAFTGIAVAFAALVGATVTLRGPLAAVLGNRVLGWIGQRSYGLYIWHALVGVVVRLSMEPFRASLPAFDDCRYAVWLLVTAAVAASSWAWFERPILGLKRRVPYTGSTPRPIGADYGEVSLARSRGTIATGERA